jgi:hypothetical protein
MPSGNRFASTYRPASLDPRADAPRPTIADAWKESCGFSGRDLRGANCLADTPAPAPAGGACETGPQAVCCWVCGAAFLPNWMTSSDSAGMNVSRMAALPRPKKGALRGQDQAREGHKMDGLGRWRGYSAGSTLGLGESVGSEAVGADAGDGGDWRIQATATSAWLSPAIDIGSRLRQQSVASGAERAWDRADHPGAREQSSGDAPRRAQAAAVSASVEGGTDDCVAGPLSSVGGAL